MNISFSKPNPNPTYNPATGKLNRWMRIPADTATDADIAQASSIRVLCDQAEAQAARELVEALGQKLAFAGEVKEGSWEDNTHWVTIGKKPAGGNAKAVLDRFGL